MRKKEPVEITSIEQFERIYLPEKESRQLQDTAPYEYGVALATQAIERLQVSFK